MWRFTGFYGQPDASQRHFSWDLLRRLQNINELQDIPWLVGGDFNEICYDSEKLGGNRRPFAQMRAFLDSLEACELQDLHCLGDTYTWVNRRSTENLIFERLDHFVGTLNWRLLYQISNVSSLEIFHSDHRPICLQLKPSYQIKRATNLSADIFRFEKFWLTEEECGEVVELGWGANYLNIPLTQRIFSCKEGLKSWARKIFQSLPKKLKESRYLFNDLRSSNKWASNVNRIHQLEEDIEKLATKRGTLLAPKKQNIVVKGW